MSNKLGKLFMSGVGDAGSQLVRKLDEYIVRYEELNHVKHGSNFYKPSGLDSCNRDLYYMRSSVKGREELTSANIGICDTGSYRHCVIQNTLESMSKENYTDFRWIDPETYIRDNSIYEKYKTKVVEKVGHETKLFNEKYQISFMADGLIEFMGKLYILEIKTCASFLFSKLDNVMDKHKVQATCYSMCLGIPTVLFIYEDRGLLNHKGFLFTPSDLDKLQIANKIADVEEYINKRELPPREKDKCKYCCYKEQCRKDYNPLEETKNE